MVLNGVLWCINGASNGNVKLNGTSFHLTMVLTCYEWYEWCVNGAVNGNVKMNDRSLGLSMVLNDVQ